MTKMQGGGHYPFGMPDPVRGSGTTVPLGMQSPDHSTRTCRTSWRWFL